MPSSTSSSESRPFQRPLPAIALGLAAVVALALALVLALSWELHVRKQGYVPSINDSKDLWAQWREKASSGDPNEIVLVGASRTAFDIDLDVAESVLGRRPIQLATVGSNPGPMLWHLASDEEFVGTVICGITPGLFYAPKPAPPYFAPFKAIARYDHWSPSQRVGHRIAMMLESRLALLNTADLTLAKLLQRLDIPNRSNAHTPRRVPPAFGAMTADRRLKMLSRTVTDLAFQDLVRSRWYELMAPPSKPPVFTDEQWAQMGKDASDDLLRRAADAVDAIVKRGGRVIFVRLPASGQVREIERQSVPRKHAWERILKVTGAPGIHFEDYPELASFTCPEESHLSVESAALFTERLMPIVKSKLGPL